MTPNDFNLPDDPDALASFLQTEQQYGGQAAYQAARDAGQTELTYRQWVQVRTPEFKQWFGDWENDPANASKVINERTGEPLVVYHGTRSGGFHTFDVGGSGKTAGTGAFFSETAQTAKTYSGTWDEVIPVDDSEWAEYGDEPDTPGNYEVFLNIRQPDEYDFYGNNWNAYDAQEEFFVEDENGEILEYFTNEADAEYYVADQEAEGITGLSIQKELNTDFSDSTDSLAAASRRTGADGVRFLSVVDEGFCGGSGHEDNVWVAFDPAQIKSANHNLGYFSERSNDIRFRQTETPPSVAPSPETDHLRRIQAAVVRAVGEEAAQHIRVVHSQEARLDARFSQSLSGVEGWYDGRTQTITLVADNLTEETAALTAWHELGHRGMGDAAFQQYRGILTEADQNDVVRRLADAVVQSRRGTDDPALHRRETAVEEALAELFAARKTGNYAHINQKYAGYGFTGIPTRMHDTLGGWLMRTAQKLTDLAAKVIGVHRHEVSDTAVFALLGKIDRALDNSLQPSQQSERSHVLFNRNEHSSASDEYYLDLAQRYLNGDKSVTDELRSLVNTQTARNGFDDDVSFRLQHRAPYKDEEDYNKTADNLADLYSDDIYGRHAADYFGHGEPAMDNESVRVIQSVRGNPDAEITVYRALPKDAVGTSIARGDWVTTSRTYAELHDESALRGDYKIVEKTVKAHELYNDGNSIHEWGYDTGLDTLRSKIHDREKLRDLITFDDQGGIIPLSQRFNPQQTDIRFNRSRPGVEHSFARTAEALGGEAAYQAARDAGQTELTYRQWVQVRTPEFKQWFGDWENDPANASKVINEHTGEPLVVYHGTERGGFTQFETDGWNTGVTTGSFFSEAPEVAQTYSGTEQAAQPEKREAGNYAVFLNIRQPETYDFNGDYWNEYESDDERFIVDQHGEVARYFPKAADAEAWLAEQGAAASESNLRITAERPENWHEDTNSLAHMARQDSRFDGVCFKHVIDEGKYAEFGYESSVWVAFDPTQIKSADFNDGRFSQDADIRFSRAAPQPVTAEALLQAVLNSLDAETHAAALNNLQQNNTSIVSVDGEIDR